MIVLLLFGKKLAGALPCIEVRENRTEDYASMVLIHFVGDKDKLCVCILRLVP